MKRTDETETQSWPMNRIVPGFGAYRASRNRRDAWQVYFRAFGSTEWNRVGSDGRYSSRDIVSALDAFEADGRFMAEQLRAAR